LAAGACLVLPSNPEEEDSPAPSGGLVLHAAPPATFQQPGVPVFCQDGPPGRGLLEARGGEAVYLAGLRETGIWVAGGSRLSEEAPTLGPPTVPGRLFAVDTALRPVPQGIQGELCLGGEALQIGFPDHPALTADRLVPDSFSSRPGARMLRTGMLVRGLPDGGLESLGSLRHRPAGLGEVEATLRRHPGVLDWAVRVWEPAMGGTALAIFVVPSQPLSELRDELSRLLSLCAPRSLVELKVVIVPQLPRKTHGEVDPAALPDPGEMGADERGVPRSPVEGVLAGIWAALLGIERVGVEDNLLDLGVHSLLATQLVSRVRQVFRVDLPLRSLFEQPTVAGQASRIERALQAGQTLEEAQIVPVPRDADLPLSYAQERLWFVHQVDPASSAFNIPRAVRILGDLDLPSLKRALGGLAARHESLRTRFPARDGCAVQEVSPLPALQPAIVDLSGLQPDPAEAEARRLAAEEARRPFHLSTGPLVRVSLLKLGPSDHLAVFVLHHIIADAWSMGVMVRELTAFYETFQAGRPSNLPSLPVQYADFAHWQRRWLEAGALEAQLAYWKERLRGAPEVLSLATDFSRPETQTFRGAFHPFALSPELSRTVHRLGREEGVTLFMVLLAGFSLLLSRYSGQEDIVVGTDIANRNRLELEGIIGFFVNNLVLRTDLSGNPSFRELLRRVREVTLGAYAHQDLPFDRLVKELRPRRSLSQTPLFQVLFVLQNVPVPPLRFSGLELRSMEIDFGMSKFDLALFMTERPSGLVGSWHYSTDLFHAETIARATTHFASLLESAAARPDTRLSEIEMFTPEELELRERTRREREESALGRLKSIRGRRAAEQPSDPVGGEEMRQV
ncbi:MAG TPA: condensation domain-containing protein, partial [Thermoanaerobaculia bacterium]|nr:condensation domain-containing protein [Thermoanaerobaculia bacterium]